MDPAPNKATKPEEITSSEENPPGQQLSLKVYYCDNPTNQEFRLPINISPE